MNDEQLPHEREQEKETGSREFAMRLSATAELSAPPEEVFAGLERATENHWWSQQSRRRFGIGGPLEFTRKGSDFVVRQPAGPVSSGWLLMGRLEPSDHGSRLSATIRLPAALALGPVFWGALCLMLLVSLASQLRTHDWHLIVPAMALLLVLSLLALWRIYPSGRRRSRAILRILFQDVLTNVQLSDAPDEPDEIFGWYHKGFDREKWDETRKKVRRLLRRPADGGEAEEQDRQ